jgi:hypothetical protein
LSEQGKGRPRPRTLGSAEIRKGRKEVRRKQKNNELILDS